MSPETFDIVPSLAALDLYKPTPGDYSTADDISDLSSLLSDSASRSCLEFLAEEFPADESLADDREEGEISDDGELDFKPMRKNKVCPHILYVVILCTSAAQPTTL